MSSGGGRELDRPSADWQGPPAPILGRRAAAERARRQRRLLVDAACSIAIVLVAVIAGVGIGLLGLIAVVFLLASAATLAIRRALSWRRACRARR